MTQKRTTKALASRIQVDYLKKRLLYRYWKRLLMLAGVAATAIWVVWGTWAGRQEIHLPGPLSSGHATLRAACTQCHLEPRKPVQNQSCLGCHSDLPHHRDLETHVPRCASCHLEHRSTDLSHVEPSGCAECHRSLERKDGKKSPYANGIRTLSQGHPEFRFWKEGKDKTAVLLNHKVHLKPNLEGAGGKKVTLTCSDCHSVDPKKDPEALYRSGEITFLAHCRDCHELGFDPDAPAGRVPHRSPEEVRAALLKFYQERLADDPEIFQQRSKRVLPGPEGEVKSYHSAEEWLSDRLSRAEAQLFGKVCRECHPYTDEPGTLPKIDKVEMRDLYLKLGRFDHSAHRSIACLACHEQTASSEKSEEFQVPHLQTCLRCHAKGGMAEDSCQQCHRYHQAGPEKIMEGTVRDF